MSSSREFDKSKSAPWNQDGAPRGMIKNAPHDDLPEGALAYLRNAHAFPTEVQPRLGSRIFSSLQPPALTGRTGYTASQSGAIITATSAIFSGADVSHYWVWPGDPNIHNEIQEFISTTQVRVRDSATIDNTSGCWMHAKLNLFRFHYSEKKIVVQWGTDVYVFDNLNASSWTKALCVSSDQPSNSISDWSEMDEYGVIGNSNGIFLLDFEPDIPIIFKKNTDVPGVLLESTVRTASRTHRYDYTYSMSRLNGIGLRTRSTADVKIEQESGTCILNPNTSPPRDYGIQWTAQKIGPAAMVQGRLVTGSTAAANRTPTYWRDLTGGAAGVVQMTVDGRTENLIIDFGPGGANVETIDDVAGAIQDSMRKVFPFSTCVYDWENARFIFTSGEQDGSTMDFGAAGIGVGYTDISAILNVTEATGATIDNNYRWEAPLELGVLTMPRLGTAPTEPEQHWTHYTVYRTEDSGVDGVTPRVDRYTGELLPPLKFTYVRDIRTQGAFFAARDSTGLVTILIGEIEQWDQGTPWRWEDGDIDIIGTYLSPTSFRVSTTGEAAGVYYEEAKVPQAAVIGGGRVLRASQTDDIVTIESVFNTDRITSADLRKTIVWSTGYYSIVTEILTATTFRVNDSITKETQGISIDPLSRSFMDLEPDDNLRNRANELHVGLLGHRFWTSLPLSNILTVVPGFMLSAQRGDSNIYYSQLGTSLKYKSGYYLPNRQKLDKVEGAIQTIVKAPNKFLVWCSGSLWGGPTNIPDIKELPEFGESYSLLHVDIIDEKIGCVDIGSIQEVDYGVFELRCTDNTWRQCTPQGYIKEFGDMSVDPQTGQDRVKKDLKETQSLGASAYNDVIGHVWWGRLS